MRDQIISADGLKCEICNERYMYSHELKTKCSDCNIFKRKLLARKFMAVATLTFILIGLVFLAVMTSNAISDNKDP
jgi:hypothetical protein